MNYSSTLRTISLAVVLCMAASLIAIWILAELNWDKLFTFAPVTFVGAAGATIANSSGVGGGVVFVPVFDFLNKAGLLPVNPVQIVAVSMLIQCFGMTTGSLTWLNRMQGTGVPERQFWAIIVVALASCLPSLLATQYIFHLMPASVLVWFKSLSIVLGMVLLISVWTNRADAPVRRQLTVMDIVVLSVMGLLGGLATALFSVGIGELVALWLFIRNYPLVTCAATAVVVTAFAVVSGIVYHLLHTDMPWLLAAFAAPGAMLGGYVARGFAYRLGPYRLKVLAGLWIVGSSSWLLLR